MDSLTFCGYNLHVSVEYILTSTKLYQKGLLGNSGNHR